MNPSNTLDQDKIELIEQIALAEFAANGYHRTSTNVIIRRAGVAKGSFFNYFGSKQDMYIRLLSECNDRLRKRFLASQGPQPDDYFERVLYITTTYLDVFAEEPDVFAFLMTQTDAANREVAAEYYASNKAKSSLQLSAMLDGVDYDSLRVDQDVSVRVTTWILGMIKARLFDDPIARTDPHRYRDTFVAELSQMLDVLKYGMYRYSPQSDTNRKK